MKLTKEQHEFVKKISIANEERGFWMIGLSHDEDSNVTTLNFDYLGEDRDPSDPDIDIILKW